MNDQNFKYLSSSKLDFHYIFEDFENPRIFFLNPQDFFVLFYDVNRSCSQLKLKMSAKRPKKLVYLYKTNIEHGQM